MEHVPDTKSSRFRRAITLIPAVALVTVGVAAGGGATSAAHTGSAATAAPAASTQNQEVTPAAETGATKLPKTGVGTTSLAQGTSAIALLAALAAGLLGMIAVRMQRHS